MQTLNELKAIAEVTGNTLKQANLAHATAIENLAQATKLANRTKTLKEEAIEASQPYSLASMLIQLKHFFAAIEGTDLKSGIHLTNSADLIKNEDLLYKVLIAAGGTLITNATNSITDIMYTEEGETRIKVGGNKDRKKNSRYMDKLMRRLRRPEIFKELLNYGYKHNN